MLNSPRGKKKPINLSKGSSIKGKNGGMKHSSCKVHQLSIHVSIAH